MNDSHSVDPASRRSAFVRMFSSAVVNQALLSGTSLLVGLILIRNTADAVYGYYVLILAAVLLVTQLQNSFFQPAMVERMTRFDLPQRQALIGGLITGLRHTWLRTAVVLVVMAAILGLVGVLSLELTLLAMLTVGVCLAALRREFVRTVLMSHRRVDAVFRADLVYAVLLIGGMAVAIYLPWPALWATASLGLAAVVGGTLLRRLLWAHESWETPGTVGILREIAPLALWSTAGGLIHWSFSQGYTYLVAGTLDVTAVAAIGATRLTLMPVNLLSTGIGSLMLPLAARWLHDRGARFALRRLLMFASGLAVAATSYFLVLWLLRDWVFGTILNKQFEHRDTLLLMWGVGSVLAVMRDQLVFLPVARQRFRPLTWLSASAAVVSLLTCYFGMVQFGVKGALAGVLVGESINLIGLVWLSRREVRNEDAAIASHGAGIA